MDHTQLDPALLPIFQEIEQIIGKETYDLWFKPADFTFDGTVLTVATPNAIWGKTLKDRYDRILTDVFLKHTGTVITIQYQVDTNVQTPVVSSAKDVLAETGYQPQPVLAVNPLAARFNPNYTFDNFIESPSNRFAYKAAQAVVSKLGARENNPLVIYSAPGLGKTHLLQAIGNQILRENPQAKVMYMSGEEFVNEYIESMHQKTADAFRKNTVFGLL